MRGRRALHRWRGWPVAAAAVLLAGAAPVAAVCVGDCDGSGNVGVDELTRLVGLALGEGAAVPCPAGDRNGDAAVSVDEIVEAVGYALAGCPTPPPTPTPEALCPQYNPLRNLYFGDLHVHTQYSFDAHLWDTRTTPAEAYRFARGAPLGLPPFDAQGQGARTVRLARPLDFTAVTDHSEFLGEVETCATPGSPTYDSATCQLFRTGSTRAFANFGVRMTGSQPLRFPDVCAADGRVCLDAAGAVWQRIQDAAAAAYDRCTFTSFVAYEYSRSPGASTKHRNVIFRNARVPFPISTFEAPTPQGLWRELQATCTGAGTGCDVLAIPHNSNESNGHMFFVEYPGAAGVDDERAQARFRARMEPLVEVYQHKGNSECVNGLSGIVGAPDEQCDFEARRRPPFADCGDGRGQRGAAGTGCVSRLDFVRGALLAGLQEQARLGVNPYPLGFIGGTDTHNGTPGFTEESAFVGHQGVNDAVPADLLGAGYVTDGGVIFSPGGLAAVWAEENSRDSLFEALRRRETFATSGTRLSVRVFGGWDVSADLCARADLVRVGYAQGIPMGGVLAPRPATAGAPRFVVVAQRDAGTAERPGAGLQRLQVIKGWIANGEAHQQVYDVATAAEAGAPVDPATCAPDGRGADNLCVVWDDPDFDPGASAFYYVRALETPTCRWSTWVCNRLAADERPTACDDPRVPKTVQERAWTSPIWYTPAD